MHNLLNTYGAYPLTTIGNPGKDFFLSDIGRF